nr:reverse transcriptase domain-containing protein [Tanacetum cinerariifolium]
MSTMANTTPIVTTVMKTTNKKKTPKEADAALKANILDLCEEHYEDILPVIMDKIRRDKRKEEELKSEKGLSKLKRRDLPARYRDPSERPKKRDRLKYNDKTCLTGWVIEGRAHSTDSAILARQAQLSLVRTRETQGIALTVEDVLADGALLAETVLETETAPVALKNHIVILAPPTGQGTGMDITLVTGTTPTRMSNNVKTYDGTGDPEVHLKIFQAATQVERWAMPTWCHMFNSILIGAARVWFDELPPKSIDRYKGLKVAFLAYFMQQKKYVKDSVEFHNIKQRDGETIEEFMERFKIETGRMKEAPECMRISGFMHGVKNPELIKRLNARPKDCGGNDDYHHDFHTGRNRCRFQKESSHSLKVTGPIEELVRAGKLSHFIKEIRQDRDQQKTGKKDALVKDKAAAIYMIRPWQRVTRQKVTQSFAHVKEITFPPLTANKGTGGPLVIEVETGGHAVHRIYVDRGSSMEVLYEHCFNRLRPEIKSQMVLATTSLTDFSGETIWPLGQLRLLVTIGDAEHYTKAWMNFIIVRSPSPYNATPKDPAKKAEARHEKFKVVIHPDFSNQEITIGGAVSTKARTKLCTLLKGNLDIFAWQPSDMTVVPRSIAEHRLDIREGYSPVRQKKEAGLEARQGNPSRGTKTGRGRNSVRSILPRLVIQPDHGEEARCRRNVSRIHDQSGRDKTMPRQDGGRVIAPIPTNNQKGPEPQWEAASLNGTGFQTAKATLSETTHAEYEALIVGLRIAAQMGVHNVHVSVDSKLVANQVLGTYVSKEENMIKYLEKTKSLISGFANFSISQVPRSKTKKADALSKIASTSFAHLSKQFLVEILKEKSIQEKEMTTLVEEEGPTWMTPIMEYLRDETLPDNRKEARKLYIKARQYELLEEILYRHLFLKSWLRCIGPLQEDYVIRKIHEGSCSMHAGPRSMVAKAMRSGYYWPTMHQDAREMIRKLKHPQSNRLVERANRSLGEGIKARQGEGNKNRLEELPHVLWTHRTMIKSSNDDTLFSLTYRTKAVIPAEIRMPTYCTAVVDAVHNDKELRLNLDLLKERHERAVICEAKSKLNMTKYYNARVRGITFRPGDFFYRSNDARHAVDGRKLGLKWEGPYEVTEALGDRAYKLRSTDKTVLPRKCYIANLKKCYL